MKSSWALVTVLAVLTLQLPGFSEAQNDLTVVPEESGRAVVEATVNLIRQVNSESFHRQDDKELLRRIALVETRDGTLNKTYRPNYHGGIWQVDEDMFNKTKKIVSPIPRLATNIRLEFGIDWLTLPWKELRKPLYSGLAAFLFITDPAIPEDIPLASDVAGQAKYWKTYYDLPSGPGTEEEFIKVVEGDPELCVVRGTDLVFLLDSSGSIGSNNFQQIKTVVTNIVENLVIGPDDSQVAVIKYSSSVHTEFHLNEHDNKTDLIQAISEIVYIGGGTLTHLGLQEVLIEFNTYARPVGEGIPRVAFVLTDGQSNYDLTAAAAKELHNAKIVVYAVAIGDGPNEKELSAIATSDEHVLNTGFAVVELKELQERIDREACEANVIAIVGQEFNSTLREGQVALFVYDLPEDGLTLKIEVDEGFVVVYISTKVKKPNEALHDAKLVTSTTVDIYIPPQSPSPTERRRRQSTDDPPANETAKVYISIEGQSPVTRFVMNTTNNDTTTPREPPLKVKFTRDSPVVSGNNVSAFIESNIPGVIMTCKISGIKEVKNCTSGYVEFNELPDGNPYKLVVSAKTEGGQTTTIKRKFRIEQTGYCTAHLINEGVSVNENVVKIEFSPTGDTENTLCLLNPPQSEDNKFFSCKSPVIMYLSSGSYTLKITPKGCGPYRNPLKVKFNVE